MKELHAEDAKECREARKQGVSYFVCEVRNAVVVASHCLRVLVVCCVVLHFPCCSSLRLFGFVRGSVLVRTFCLFCCGPIHVSVVPVSERPLWPFCNCPCLWLCGLCIRFFSPVWVYVTIGAVTFPPTLFLHPSCCLGMFVSSHSLFNCFVFAHMFGWCELCVVFAPLSCAIVTAATVATHRAVLCGTEDSGKRSQASSLRLRQICAAPAGHGNRDTSRFLPLGTMSQKVGKFG